jgi:hypothetical protein
MQATLRVLNQLEADGVIRKYAIGGAMGMLFHAEPLLTYDLDVFVFLAESSSVLISLEPIYSVLRSMGWKEDKEHVVIAGMPVQFIPAYNALVNEAVEQAVEVHYKEVPAHVLGYEHLLAIMLQTGRPKDLARIRELLAQRKPSAETWLPLLQRHDLVAKWNRLNQPEP